MGPGARETLASDTLFQPGDHLRINCNAFDHHAIFIKWVNPALKRALLVQHTGKQKTATIELGEENVSRHKLVTRPSDPASVVQRAMSRVGEGGYNLVMKNCEHFCTWCLNGEPTSTQIQRGLAVSAAQVERFTGGNRKYGSNLIATNIAVECSRAIWEYIRGDISLEEVAQRSLVAVGGAAGGVLGGAVGAATGAALSKAIFGESEKAKNLGGLLGGIAGGLLGGHVGASTTRSILDHFPFGSSRGEAVQNAYNTMDLTPDATNDEINQRFRQLALKYHPDRPGGSTEVFQELNTAMEIIRASRADEMEPFPVGTFVKVRWNQGTHFYLGRIEKAHGNQTYDIQYHDGDYECNVDIRFIRPASLPVGTIVHARKMRGPRYCRGSIDEAHGNQTYGIQYDDGDYECDVDIRCIILSE